MNFFGIGPLEFLVIAVVALLVLGPDRLPRFAQRLGVLITQARRSIAEARDSVLSDLDIEGMGEAGQTDGKKSTQRRPTSSSPD